MDEPTPVGDTLDAEWVTALRRKMPPHITPDPDLPLPDSHRETDEDRAERVTLARRNRVTRWERRLPARYVDAALDQLDGVQNPDGIVAGWVDSGRLNMVLAGNPGAGKTYAAYAVGNHAVRALGWSVEGWTAPDLNDALRPGGGGTEGIETCDLLIVDDLGRERVTEWTLEQLHRILDARNRAKLRTIVTTNMTSDQWVRRYGAAVVDRVLDDAVVVRVNGPTRRVMVF